MIAPLTNEYIRHDVSNFHDPVFCDLELKKCIVTATEVIEEPPACFSINGIVVGTLGNISMLIGKQKQGKTFATSMVMAAVERLSTFGDVLSVQLPPDKQVALFIDTEQGRFHVQRVVQRIATLAAVKEPERLKTYGMRPYSPAERLAMIEHLIYHTPNLGFVVIDGVRDLITSINDEEEASMITSKLLKWSQELGIHIMVVLHMNKGDNNARGHLGTELQNKAETVLSVTKTDSTTIVVQPVSTRGEEPKDFAFSIDHAGIPFLLPNWSPEKTRSSNKDKLLQPYQVNRTTHMDILRPIFNKQKEYSSADLQHVLGVELERWNGTRFSRDRIAGWKAYYLKEGIITQIGTPGTKSVRFRLTQEPYLPN